MRAEYLVDWLSITYDTDAILDFYPSLEDNLKSVLYHAPVLAHVKESFVPAAPRYGYRYVANAPDGTSVHWTSANSDMGMHVSYPGQAINKHGGIAMLRYHMANGARVTRLDLAADLFDARMPIELLFDMMRAREEDLKLPAGKDSSKGAFGRAVTRSRKYFMMSGSTGATLYIGSRTSERMMRIYDKRAQAGETGGEHWRAEIELKGPTAHKAAEILLERGTEAIRGILKSVCHFPGVVEWEYLIDFADVIVVRSEARAHDTRGWILGNVAKIVANQARREPGFLTEFLVAVQEHQIERQDNH